MTRGTWVCSTVSSYLGRCRKISPEEGELERSQGFSSQPLLKSDSVGSIIADTIVHTRGATFDTILVDSIIVGLEKDHLDVTHSVIPNDSTHTQQPLGDKKSSEDSSDLDGDEKHLNLSYNIEDNSRRKFSFLTHTLSRDSSSPSSNILTSSPLSPFTLDNCSSISKDKHNNGSEPPNFSLPSLPSTEEASVVAPLPQSPLLIKTRIHPRSRSHTKSLSSMSYYSLSPTPTNAHFHTHRLSQLSSFSGFSPIEAASPSHFNREAHSTSTPSARNVEIKGRSTTSTGRTHVHSISVSSDGSPHRKTPSKSTVNTSYTSGEVILDGIYSLS